MRTNDKAVECRTRHFLHTLSTVTFQAEVGCDISVGIATCYRMDGQGFESLWGRDVPHSSRPLLRPTEPAVTRTLILFLGVKVAGVWRWPPTTSNTEVKENVLLHLYLTSSLHFWG